MKSQQQLKQTELVETETGLIANIELFRRRVSTLFQNCWVIQGKASVERKFNINSFIFFNSMSVKRMAFGWKTHVISHLFQQRTSHLPNCESGFIHTFWLSLFRITLENRQRNTHWLTVLWVGVSTCMCPWCGRRVLHSHDCDFVAAGTLWVHFEIPHLTPDSVSCSRTQTPARDERAVWLSHCTNRIRG